MSAVRSPRAVPVYRFGDYELDRRTLELSKSGAAVKLAPQPARMLALLASRPGELVSRDEIRRELWGDGTFVDFDRNLNYCLTCIREALGDTARSPRYIETLPRRGYRFISKVERPRAFPEPTLAVLPFANLNGDSAREYFADGITDALITELARIDTVRVISRQSVLHLKGGRGTMAEIARDLSVDGIVEGAVLHDGSRVRVTAQLIVMEPERHVWADAYECDVSAILTTQRKAARAIAACVSAVLKGDAAGPSAQALPGPEGTPPSPGIVEIFLKAMAGIGKQSAQGLEEALRCFAEVTAKAPDFAPGLSGYASCLFSLGWWGEAPAHEVYPSARRMLEQAVAMDDRLDSAHMMLGFLYWLLDWDIAAAEREFLRAIELSPSNPEARIFYAIFLCCVGRHSESMASAEYGLQLNPTSLLPNQAAAWNYLHNGRPDLAEALATRVIQRFPEALQPHLVLGWAAWSQGRPEEAVALFERAVALSRQALSISFLGHVYGRTGRRDEALRLLDELGELSSRGKASPIAHVVLHAGLGDAESAFGWIETAFRLRSDLPWFFTRFPGLDPLRSDLRFAALVPRIPTAL